MFFTPLRFVAVLLLGIVTTGWQRWFFPQMIYAQLSQSGQRELAAGSSFRLRNLRNFPDQLAKAALDRAGAIVRYDIAYHKITFPMGDIPSGTGCGADEIVRAYREMGIDLQELVYLDMVRSFGAYPRVKDKWQPDTNMDHRLVPNLHAYFKRCGVTVPLTYEADDYKPGDLITCNLPNGQEHIAIVVPSPSGGRPWIVHNMGYGPRLEDRLFEFTLTGHYRYHPGGLRVARSRNAAMLARMDDSELAARMRADMEAIGRMPMPFGKFGPKSFPPHGVPIYDLPVEYLAWFARKGFPKGRLGDLLKIVHQMKADGSDAAFDIFRKDRGRTRLRPERRREWNNADGEIPF